MTQPHILIIDDDEDIRTLLKSFLQKENWLISTAYDAFDAQNILKTLQPDVIILDVMMPKKSGIEFLTELRQSDSPHKESPVLMLTAAVELNNKVDGLLAGADDYIAKPFNPEELVLRIKAVLRRVRPEINNPNKIKIGDMEFDFERGILSNKNAVMKLTESESALLQILATNPGVVFSRLELSQHANLDGNDRTIDVQITRLRKKIEPNPKIPTFVQTIRGKGYILRV